MANNTNTIELSINRGITPHITKDAANSIVRGWSAISLPWTEDAVKDVINNYGIMPSTITSTSNHKIAENIEYTSNLVLDFDKNVDVLDMVINKVKKWSFGAYVFTTVNHKKIQDPETGELFDRFRIFIPLEGKVTSKKHLAMIAEFIMDNNFPNLTLDKSCTDMNRYFYPCIPTTSYFHPADVVANGGGEFLDIAALLPKMGRPVNEKLRTLKEQAEEEKWLIKQRTAAARAKAEEEKRLIKEHSANAKAQAEQEKKLIREQIKALKEQEKAIKTIKDITNFNPDMEVVLENGTITTVDKTNGHTPILCPYCGNNPDRSRPGVANAFIDKNDYGTYYIFCSSEQLTRWQEPSTIDFNSYQLFFNENTGCICSADINDDTTPLHNFRSEKDWKNFCTNNNVDYKIQSSLKRAKVIFDTKRSFGLDAPNKVFNLYNESKLLMDARQDVKNKNLTPYINKNNLRQEIARVCPTIEYVIHNVIGDELLWEFYNWLAYITQYREKTFTNWIISTVPGAGKGVIAERLLPSLFGFNAVSMIPGNQLMSRFNSMDAMVLFKIIDECFVENNLSENSKRKEYLKSIVGNLTNNIEAKGVDKIKVKSFTNYIIYSNRGALAFVLDSVDRRSFVVDNKNSKELSKEPTWNGRTLFEAQFDSEIQGFAKLLMAIQVSEDEANTAKVSAPKLLMQEVSQEDAETFIDILKKSEWNKLVDLLVEHEVIEDDHTVPIVLAEIERCKGMPARFMKKFLVNVLGTDRTFIRKRLKGLGLYSTEKKGVNDRNIKVYRA